MAQCFRCNAETQLFDNGTPICLECATEKDRAKPPGFGTPLGAPFSCPERERLVEALFKAVHEYKRAVKAVDGTAGNDSTFALEKADRAKAACARFRSELQRHDDQHRCKPPGTS